jgi:hypothetical protein
VGIWLGQNANTTAAQDGFFVNEELNEIRLFSMFGAACVNLNIFRLCFPLGVSFLPKAAPRAGFPATGAADPCSRPTAQDDS